MMKTKTDCEALKKDFFKLAYGQANCRNDLI